MAAFRSEINVRQGSVLYESRCNFSFEIPFHGNSFYSFFKVIVNIKNVSDPFFTLFCVEQSVILGKKLPT